MTKSRIIRRLLKWSGWFIGGCAAVFVACELFLSSASLTNLVNKVADRYIDGEISFGKVEVSLFRRFPRANILLEDFAITYPSSRFDEEERSGAQGWLLHQGCSETCDTLASFERFSAGIRIGPLLAGKINLSHLELYGPRIFAHNYGDGKANWNIFKTEESEQADTVNSPGFPDVTVSRIMLDRKPFIVYTDSKDTLFAAIGLKKMEFRDRHGYGFRIDSLFAAGRVKNDTLAFGLGHLGINERKGILDLHAKAKAHLATGLFGRFDIPIGLKGHITLPKRKDNFIRINHLNVDIASIPLEIHGKVEFLDDRIRMDAGADIRNCGLNDLLRGAMANLIPDSRKISTDAVLNFMVAMDGDYMYDGSGFPAVTASLSIPSGTISHRDFMDEVRIDIAAEAGTDSEGRIVATLKNGEASTNGASLKMTGKIHDILCNDPRIVVDGKMSLMLDSLVTLLPDTLGISAAGKIDAGFKGNIKQSQLDFYKFSDAEVLGEASFADVSLKVPKDTIDLYVSRGEIKLAPEEKKSSRTGETFRMFALKGAVDSTDITYKTLALVGSGLDLSMMNSTGFDKDTSDIHRFGGRFKAGKLLLADNTGMSVVLRGSDNGFQVLPKRNNPRVPVLTLTSRNKAIFYKDDINRVLISDAKIGANATMNTIERRQRMKAYRDSLARLYPDIPRDSLLLHAFKASDRSYDRPEWMKEEDFRKQDINFRLDETFAKYFREWDMNGRLSLGRGMLMTPYFPLRNMLQGFEGRFDNNSVRIDSLRIAAGRSNLAVQGELNGISRMLSGRGRNMLNLDLAVNSDRVDAKELMKGYIAGSSFKPAKNQRWLTETSDDQYMEKVLEEASQVQDSMASLIVVPANLNANVRIDARNICYGDLDVQSLKAKAVIKERCIQITETAAVSNVGDISLDGFYATRSKADIKAGFNVNLKDITAEKVIALAPAVDTLMPILKSFQGRLNCEMAATTRLDTNMNIVIPSLNGILRVTGNDLSIKDNKLFRSVARKLLFKNRREGHIEKMSVEGLISNSTVEIFPFILQMDRYLLALSGVQNLDMSFKYHVSVIRSPFLFKLGIDLSGDNFDDFKYRIGKPKYKNASVPVFSSVIDATKINLMESIRNIYARGVDETLKDYSKMREITEHKQRIGYVRATDQKIEELSEEEKKQMEAAEAEDEQNLDQNQ